MSIGNQWTDPNTQILTHAAQAFYLGLVDERQSEHLVALAHEAVAKNLVCLHDIPYGRKEIRSEHWKFVSGCLICIVNTPAKVTTPFDIF
jgi:hypothetical protein